MHKVFNKVVLGKSIRPLTVRKHFSHNQFYRGTKPAAINFARKMRKDAY